MHNEDMYESISIRTPCRSETFREKEIRNFKAPKEAFGVSSSLVQDTLASLSPLSSSPKRQRLTRRARQEEQI